MAKNGKNGTGKAKTSPAVVGLSDREAYVLDVAPTILAALMVRKDGRTANEATDTAMEVAGHIWDVVNAEPRPSTDYLLDKIPLVLSGLMLRRLSTAPHELIPLVLSSVERIYDVIHELDAPATAMMSMPVRDGMERRHQ